MLEEFLKPLHRKHGDSNKRFRQRRLGPSQEIMIFKCVRSCKFYPKLRLASGFTLTKSTRTVTLQDVPLLNVTSGSPYDTAEVSISIREYPENYQKLQLQTSFSQERLIVSPRNFALQVRRSSPMTVLSLIALVK